MKLIIDRTRPNDDYGISEESYLIDLHNKVFDEDSVRVSFEGDYIITHWFVPKLWCHPYTQEDLELGTS